MNSVLYYLLVFLLCFVLAGIIGAATNYVTWSAVATGILLAVILLSSIAYKETIFSKLSALRINHD